MEKRNNSKSPQPKIRLEKRAGGKFVTVIAGLHTYGSARLNAMAKAFKTTCGAGGTVKNGTIEIQGDQVQKIQNWFTKSEATAEH
ncbi:MAG TPA: translation initiation factor [bacterium]|nr:translation initiation factor [bacterium]